MVLLRAPLLALLPLLMAPAVAYAGACPQCTTNADCVTVTEDPNAVCVEWTTDFGCGQQRVSCCPGQNCALVGTQPSCQLAGACAPFTGGANADAAVALDVGGLDGASIPPPVDGSAGALDDAATSTSPDASSVGRLGGGSANRESRCNCEAATATDAPAAALALAATVWFVARRRRVR